MNFNEQIELGENNKVKTLVGIIVRESAIKPVAVQGRCFLRHKNALRELILNMIVHRDYRSPSESCIKSIQKMRDAKWN
jgi:hypothetical protein